MHTFDWFFCYHLWGSIFWYRFSFNVMAGRPPPPFNSAYPLSIIPVTQLGELFLFLSDRTSELYPAPGDVQEYWRPPPLVSLSCATANATIYYTTDGSTPTPGATSSSTQTYTSPIAVSATTTMMAVAVCPGHLDSLVVEAQFCFAGKVIFFSLQT